MDEPRPERRRFAVDLHVHTRRYSPCAEFLREEELAERARAAGLDGVLITDHDVLWSEDEIRPLRDRAGRVRLYRGIECTAEEGHAVVVGLDDRGPIRKGMPFADIVRHAHATGAVVILAHPYRDADPDRIDVSLADAVEVGSTSFSRDEARRAHALAERYGKPKVASSDAHALSRLGWAWTTFPTLPADEHELAVLIRGGRGTPVVPRPFPA